MYPVVLGLHNAVRWIVLGVGVWAVILAWRGWLGRRQWSAAEARATRAFVGVLDLQFLIGLVLFGALSPLTRQAFSDIGAAMRDAPVRYFLLEHPMVMLAAIGAAHVGAVKVRRATNDAERFQRASVWLGLSLAAVAGFIPWARPMVPSF